MSISLSIMYFVTLLTKKLSSVLFNNPFNYLLFIFFNILLSVSSKFPSDP